jgi:hypothetical protein
MSTKSHFAGGAEKLADSFCAVFAPQGSFATKTTARPLWKKLTEWRGDAFRREGWDAIVIDTFDHLDSIESMYGSRTPKADNAKYTYFINIALNPERQAQLSGLLADHQTIIVGPKVARDPFVWGLKKEALRRGSLFEITDTNSASAFILEACLEVAAKAAKALRLEPTQPDSLKGLPGIIAAAAQFRSGRGKLDADKLREPFGLTRTELLKLSGAAMTEQAIAATPDSEKLQPFLEKLERCARLLVLLKSQAHFATWLNTSNPELEAKPIDLIRSGKTEVVADLVEDILTNRPS